MVIDVNHVKEVFKMFVESDIPKEAEAIEVPAGKRLIQVMEYWPESSVDGLVVNSEGNKVAEEHYFRLPIAKVLANPREIDYEMYNPSIGDKRDVPSYLPKGSIVRLADKDVAVYSNPLLKSYAENPYRKGNMNVGGFVRDGKLIKGGLPLWTDDFKRNYGMYSMLLTPFKITSFNRSDFTVFLVPIEKLLQVYDYEAWL